MAGYGYENATRKTSLLFAWGLLVCIQHTCTQNAFRDIFGVKMEPVSVVAHNGVINPGSWSPRCQSDERSLVWCPSNSTFKLRELQRARHVFWARSIWVVEQLCQVSLAVNIRQHLDLRCFDVWFSVEHNHEVLPSPEKAFNLTSSATLLVTSLSSSLPSGLSTRTVLSAGALCSAAANERATSIAGCLSETIFAVVVGVPPAIEMRTAEASRVMISWGSIVSLLADYSETTCTWGAKDGLLLCFELSRQFSWWAALDMLLWASGWGLQPEGILDCRKFLWYHWCSSSSWASWTSSSPAPRSCGTSESGTEI